MPGLYQAPVSSQARGRVNAAVEQRNRLATADAAGKAVFEQSMYDDAAKRQASAELLAMEKQRGAKPRDQVRFRGMARLRTLDKDFGARSLTAPVNDERGPDGVITIWLPCLPETIELARGNHYDQAGNTLVTPDGIWIYQYTEPLEIPLSFHLHAFDDLCPEGAKTLLDIAARLQAMQLPVSNDRTNDFVKPAPAVGADGNKGPSAEQLTRLGRSSVGVISDNTTVSKDASFKFPAACELRLMSAGSKTFGINCVGFIKQTKVSLHGPYLNTVDESEGFNLPSAATYEFVFVHNPAYTNAMGSGKLIQAYGPDVHDHLYNTGHLAKLSGNAYDGLEVLTQGRSAGDVASSEARILTGS